MRISLRKISQVDPAFVSTETELLQSTSRSLIAVVGALSVGGMLLAAAKPEDLATGVLATAGIALMTCLMTARYLARDFVLSQIIWQVGLAAAVCLAVYLFRVPMIGLLLSMLPLMSVVSLGWPAALASQLLIAAVVTLLAQGVPPILPQEYGVATLVGGAIAGTMGWSSSRALLTATAWSLFSYEQARKNLDETREHRAELARTVRDLDRAYYSLNRANNMLVLARAEAEEARDSRNRLALAISHELRTPLNFIIGFSELMVNSPETYGPVSSWPPGLYEDVQEIHRSSSHLQRLVNDVLTLGQIESLQMTLFKQRTDPSEIVRDVEKMVSPAFARKNLAFLAEVEPGLPEISIDTTRIRQVLLNLVSNSLRVTEHGEVTVHVRRGEGEVEFCVADTGPGIAAEDLRRIFQDFTQAGRGNWRRHEGGGLGLPISRRFVELHGGHMRVESELGKGSQFYFSLPLPDSSALSHLADSSARQGNRRWQELQEKAQNEQLLLAVSSDPSASEVLAPYVEGYGVVGVGDTREVPAAVRELLPRALLVDQVMAMHGEHEETEKYLNELPFDVPIVEFAFPGSLQHPLLLPDGVVRFLVKPVERTTLIEAILALGPNARRLLVVDDDPAMARFVRRALRSAEIQLSRDTILLPTAPTGALALQYARNQKPDAVLLDLALPDMSGWNVLRELRAMGIPVILMTAYDYPQALTRDVQDVLRVKMRRPLARDELRLIMNTLLQVLRPGYPANQDTARRAADPSARSVS